MRRLVLMAVGCAATGFAIAGALLPGLPTTPFLLIALWAFARSSERLMQWLDRLPVLRHALAEARRFEERRTIRRDVKAFAVAMAWGSVLIVGIASGLTSPLLFGSVTAAAIGGSFAMWWFPTDTGEAHAPPAQLTRSSSNPGSADAANNAARRSRS